MTDAEKENKSINIRIDLDNVKDPLDMTPEEREQSRAATKELVDTMKDVLLDMARYVLSASLDGEPDSAALDGQLSLFQQDQPAEKRKRRRNQEAHTKAIEMGAQMSIGGRVAAPSLESLSSSLNPFCIKKLPETIDKKAAFKTTGELKPNLLDGNKLEELSTLDGAFLMALFKTVINTQDDGRNEILVYLPGIMRDINLDPRERSWKRKDGEQPELKELRYNTFMKRLLPFDPYVGIAKDGSVYRVAAFTSYDSQSETIAISTPYLFTLRRIAEELAGEKAKYNELLHANIVTETNLAAVEIANRILCGIERRGTRVKKKNLSPKKKTIKTKDQTVILEFEEPPKEDTTQETRFVWDAKFSTLIKDCPQIARELEEIEKHGPEATDHETGEIVIDEKTGKPKKYNRNQAYNAKLKVFDAACRILLEKSDAPAKYEDFTIDYITPTKSTLSHKITISYTKIRRSWKKTT